MYLPAQFKEDRPVVLRALMRLSPFATLVVPTDTGLEANLLPLLVRESEHGVELVGHVARSNPVWKRPVLGEALALFAGPEGYISPSTYASNTGQPPRFCTICAGNLRPLLSRYCEYSASTSMSPKIGFSTHVCTRSTRFWLLM